jgi:hypothetical protein
MSLGAASAEEDPVTAVDTDFATTTAYVDEAEVEIGSEDATGTTLVVNVVSALPGLSIPLRYVAPADATGAIIYVDIPRITIPSVIGVGVVLSVTPSAVIYTVTVECRVDNVAVSVPFWSSSALFCCAVLWATNMTRKKKMTVDPIHVIVKKGYGTYEWLRKFLMRDCSLGRMGSFSGKMEDEVVCWGRIEVDIVGLTVGAFDQYWGKYKDHGIGAFR